MTSKTTTPNPIHDLMCPLVECYPADISMMANNYGEEFLYCAHCSHECMCRIINYVRAESVTVFTSTMEFDDKHDSLCPQSSVYTNYDESPFMEIFGGDSGLCVCLEVKKFREGFYTALKHLKTPWRKEPIYKGRCDVCGLINIAAIHLWDHPCGQCWDLAISYAITLDSELEESIW